MSEQANGRGDPADLARPGNDAVVRALAKYLAAAKAGNFDAIAIVLASDAGFQIDCCGNPHHSSILNLGLDLVKDSVLKQVVTSSQQPRQTIDIPLADLIKAQKAALALEGK